MMYIASLKCWFVSHTYVVFLPPAPTSWRLSLTTALWPLLTSQTVHPSYCKYHTCGAMTLMLLRLSSSHYMVFGNLEGVKKCFNKYDIKTSLNLPGKNPLKIDVPPNWTLYLAYKIQLHFVHPDPVVGTERLLFCKLQPV